MKYTLSFFLILSIIVTTCTRENKNYIEVFAGSASKPALDEISILFEKETGIEVRRIYGGSGTVLASMILSKRGDIYLPGSQDFMNKAIDKGVIDKDTIRLIAYLIPAIIVQKNNPKNITRLEDLLRNDISYAIGDPRSVCVGLYAVEIFENAELTYPIRNKVSTYAESCEKTANLISLKAVDAVIGWDVFGKWNPENASVVLIDKKFAKRAAYIPAAISNYSIKRDNAEKFLKYLNSTGKEIYRKYGYIVSEDELHHRYGDIKIGGVFNLNVVWK